MVADLGFINPQGHSAVISINHLVKDKITKITTHVNGIPQYTKLEGLHYSIAGIIKEFPDLKDKPHAEMKKIALKRLKEHLGTLKTEAEVINYVVKELKKIGYIPKIICKPGFRPRPLK